MHKIILTLVLSLVPALALAAGNTTNDSFNTAKRMLEHQVYFDHRVTIYCSAEFNAQKRVTLPAGFTTPAHENGPPKLNGSTRCPLRTSVAPFQSGETGTPNASTATANHSRAVAAQRRSIWNIATCRRTCTTSFRPSVR